MHDPEDIIGWTLIGVGLIFVLLRLLTEGAVGAEVLLIILGVCGLLWQAMRK